MTVTASPPEVVVAAVVVTSSAHPFVRTSVSPRARSQSAPPSPPSRRRHRRPSPSEPIPPSPRPGPSAPWSRGHRAAGPRRTVITSLDRRRCRPRHRRAGALASAQAPLASDGPLDRRRRLDLHRLDRLDRLDQLDRLDREPLRPRIGDIQFHGYGLDRIEAGGREAPGDPGRRPARRTPQRPLPGPHATATTACASTSTSTSAGPLAPPRTPRAVVRRPAWRGDGGGWQWRGWRGRTCTRALTRPRRPPRLPCAAVAQVTKVGAALSAALGWRHRWRRRAPSGRNGPSAAVATATRPPS